MSSIDEGYKEKTFPCRYCKTGTLKWCQGCVKYKCDFDKCQMLMTKNGFYVKVKSIAGKKGGCGCK